MLLLHCCCWLLAASSAVACVPDFANPAVANVPVGAGFPILLTSLLFLTSLLHAAVVPALIGDVPTYKKIPVHELINVFPAFYYISLSLYVCSFIPLQDLC
jgi:hypothetical protein